jgi:hypothetical protein
MRTTFVLVASLAVLGLSTPSSAQVISVSQVLAGCPDIPLAHACLPLASQFLADRSPGTDRNGEIVDLVFAIAEIAPQDGVPRPACINAAAGLRVLATGITIPDQANQINDIADALCRSTQTAAIGGVKVPESLSTTSSGGGSGGGGGDPGDEICGPSGGELDWQ